MTIYKFEKIRSNTDYSQVWFTDKDITDIKVLLPAFAAEKIQFESVPDDDYNNRTRGMYRLARKDEVIDVTPALIVTEQNDTLALNLADALMKLGINFVMQSTKYEALETFTAK